MKKKARHYFEENIEAIAEDINNGVFYLDIYNKLVEQNKFKSHVTNFRRLINSNRYPLIIKALRKKKLNKKNKK